ncbi:MAG TPA: PfkB family carbohydrate kinase [Patescibacteria group bacterium]|nr:PfkB family carbohydrate kinase [Patescibacteria group bacterium]
MTTTPTRQDLLRIVDRMAGVRVLVVADLVLDEFEYGRIGRISREAPVLILDHLRTDRLPGGGANAVRNLCALGGRPVVVGRLGADEAGDRLAGLLAEAGADVEGVWRESGYATPVKRRVLAGSAHSVKQQVVRIDRGGGAPFAEGMALGRRVAEHAAGTAGTLVSDYSLGLLHPGSIPAVVAATGAPSRPLFVDSRSQLRLFRGITAATPNLQEAETLAGSDLGDDVARLDAGAGRLRDALDADAVVVTLGSHGMLVRTRTGGSARIPVYGTDEVADVTGAGDTVIATLALASLSGAGFLEAALLANYAGGIVVMKRGTATVTPDELRAAVRIDPDFESRLGPR